jgi:ribosomal protein L11 methyltransferase
MSAANDAIFREISVDLPKADSLALAIALDEGQALPELSGYFETLYDETRPGDDRTQFTLYFPIQEELAAVRVEVLLAALALADAQVVEKTIRREDYLQAYKQHYVSFDLSDRVRIVPSWERDSPANNGSNPRTPLFLDPGLAFGTGKHPTTALCV